VSSAEYLKTAQGDLNVLAVDWTAISQNASYLIPVGNVPFVAQTTADLITNLVKLNLTMVKYIHLIGFSLGAHVVGAIGMILQAPKGLGKKVPRITGEID
jgi:hypothetical protein